MSLNVEFALGYHGSQVDFVDQETIVSICGNSLRMHHLAKGQQKFLWGADRGISTYALSRARKLIAYAAKGEEAAVHVHDLQSLEELGVFADLGQMEVAAMAFSRLGERMLTVSKEPDMRLIVFDMSDAHWGERVVETTTKAEAEFASFNPGNMDELFVMGHEMCTVYSIDGTFTAVSISPLELVLEGFAVLCHAWLPAAKLLLGCEGGELLIADSRTGALLRTARQHPAWRELGLPVCALLAHRAHVLAATQDGVLRFFAHPKWDAVQEDLTLLHETTIATSEEEELEVTSMVYSPLYNMVVIATSEASMHKVVLVRPEDQASDEDGKSSFCEVSAMAEFHCGAVTGLVPLPSGDHFATCGVDGSLRVWNARFRTMDFKRQFASKQVCLAVSAAANMIAIGSSEGVVRLFSLTDRGAGEPVLVFRARLHQTDVSHIAFSPSGLFVVTYSPGGVVFFVATGMEPGTEPRPLYFTRNIPDTVACLVWSTLENAEAGNEACDGLILMGMANGELVSMQPPQPSEVKVGPDMELQKQDTPLRRMRLETPLEQIDALPKESDDMAQVVISLAADKMLKRFVLPQDAAGWGGPTGRPRAADAETPATLKAGGSLTLSGNYEYLLVGSGDGSVTLRGLTDWTGAGGHVLERMLHDSYLGGVSGAAFGMNSDFVVTCGKDGGMFIMTAKQLNLSHEVLTPPLYMSAMEVDDAYDDPNEPSAVEIQKQLQERYDAEALAEPTIGGSDETLEVIDGLRMRFQQLRSKNATGPDLEKLEPSEFIIDHQMKDELEATGNQRVVEVRVEVTRGNIQMSMIADRIKSECWDSMKQSGQFLRSMKTGKELCNFPMRENKSMTTKANRVLFLRAVEKKEEEQRSLERIQAGEATSDSNEHSGGVESPKAANVENENGGEDSPTDEGEEKSEKVQGSAVEQMLYSSFVLIGQLRKRSQMLILELVLQERKATFNARFEEVRARKLADVDKILDLNERIAEIHAELRMDDEELFVPRMHEREDKGSVLVVKDTEVEVQKYVSPQELEAARAKKAAEEARARAGEGGDFNERALKHMMGGKLEMDRDGNKMAELKRPEWMHGERSAMTEDQLKQIKEFEVKEKAFLEELEVQKKSLAAELKKLKGEAADCVARFDDAFARFQMEQLLARASVYEGETQLINLAIATEQALESDEMHEKNLVGELESLKVKKGKSTAVLTDFKRDFDGVKEMHDELVIQDKQLEKSFRRDFQDCEEYVDVLFKLFRRRQRAPKKGEAPLEGADASRAKVPDGMHALASHTSKRIIGDVQAESRLNPAVPRPLGGDGVEDDPFTGNVEMKAPPAKVLADPLDPYTDKPEGLDHMWWEQLVQVRNDKIASETEVLNLGIELKEMQKCLHRLTDEDDGLRSRIEQLLKDLKEFREERIRSKYNLEVPQHLKQGQIEIDLAGATMDLSDAVLVHRSVVEDVNEVIKKHGGSKVDTLTAIKDFKKGIYDVQWLNIKLEMDGVDLVNLTKELQLLRVTKSLQDVLKNGEDSQSAQEVQSLEALLEHNRQMQEKRVNEAFAKLRNIQKSSRERLMQNEEIQHQIYGMGAHVAEQMRIKSGQEQQAQPVVTSEKRMRSLVTHRKLVDISKAQKEEMVLLREELERLRLRTFPSFVEMQPPSSLDERSMGHQQLI